MMTISYINFLGFGCRLLDSQCIYSSVLIAFTILLTCLLSKITQTRKLFVFITLYYHHYHITITILLLVVRPFGSVKIRFTHGWQKTQKSGGLNKTYLSLPDLESRIT